MSMLTTTVLVTATVAMKYHFLFILSFLPCQSSAENESSSLVSLENNLHVLPDFGKRNEIKGSGKNYFIENIISNRRMNTESTFVMQ